MKDAKFNTMRDEVMNEASKVLNVSPISETRFKVTGADFSFEVSLFESTDNAERLTFSVHRLRGNVVLYNLASDYVSKVVAMINERY